jgi:Fe-S cluster biogenesis protein NfuA
MSQDIRKKVAKVLLELGALLKADKAELELLDVTQDGVVRIRLKGLCADCTDSMMALGKGIEKVLKEQVPEIQEVVIL